MRKSTQKGFTLVEVLASIVIISVILLGVAQLMLFTNKTAVSNNSKLVTTHLAKATMERIKIEPDTYFSFSNVSTEKKEYTKNNCQVENCEELYEFYVNDQTYDVTVQVSQNDEEKELDLINVFVTVQQANKNTKSSVEGYVVDETSNE